MITAIEIENFKAIGKRQRVEIRPITLFFGPNSAGKSTILQAVHYVREILQRRNLDADRTVTGGDFVDLGGFRNFVHGHKASDHVSIRFEFTVDDLALPEFMYAKDDDTIYEMPTRPIGEQVRSAAVELVIEWSELEQKPFVAKYAVDLNGEPFGQLVFQAGRKTVEMTGLNWMHSIFSDIPNQLGDDTEHPLFRHYLAAFGYDQYSTPYEVQISLAGQPDALPLWDKPLPLVVRPADEPDVAQEHAIEEFVACMTQLIAGPGQLLRDMLADFRYLGPLREKPDRKYQAPRFADASRWASGIGAWDTIHGDSNPLLERINVWLAGEDRLDTGYSIRRKRYKELDVEGPLMVQLSSERAFDDVDDLRADLAKLSTYTRVTLVEDRTQIEVEPQDVGEGISQILPVVVALLAPGPRLIAIEQPELHVHPRVQVALGDLLIEKMLAARIEPSGNTAAWYRDVVLVETHSEHLLLRLLKRIRQTGRKRLPADAKPLAPDELAVVYVEPLDGGILIKPLRLDETGEFLDRWPQGFFEERGEELFS